VQVPLNHHQHRLWRLKAEVPLNQEPHLKLLKSINLCTSITITTIIHMFRRRFLRPKLPQPQQLSLRQLLQLLLKLPQPQHQPRPLQQSQPMPSETKEERMTPMNPPMVSQQSQSKSKSLRPKLSKRILTSKKPRPLPTPPTPPKRSKNQRKLQNK